MRERPILFSAPMVRALLDGRKTQTRRVVKWRGTDKGPTDEEAKRLHPSGFTHEAGFDGVKCPYGAPGDRLWVKETWGTFRWVDNLTPAELGEAPRSEVRLWFQSDSASGQNRGPLGRWRSPIHMPRWASRITLEVTGVRVERLQAITEENAMAEGVETKWMTSEWGEATSTARQAFMALWCEIHDLASWQANPWVWVVEFRRVDVASQSVPK